MQSGTSRNLTAAYTGAGILPALAFSTFVSICFAIFVTTSLLLLNCSRTSKRGKFPRGSGLNTKQPLAVEILLRGFRFKPG